MGFIFSCYIAFRDEFLLHVSVDRCEFFLLVSFSSHAMLKILPPPLSFPPSLFPFFSPPSYPPSLSCLTGIDGDHLGTCFSCFQIFLE